MPPLNNSMAWPTTLPSITKRGWLPCPMLRLRWLYGEAAFPDKATLQVLNNGPEVRDLARRLAKSSQDVQASATEFLRLAVEIV